MLPYGRECNVIARLYGCWPCHSLFLQGSAREPWGAAELLRRLVTTEGAKIAPLAIAEDRLRRLHMVDNGHRHVPLLGELGDFVRRINELALYVRVENFLTRLDLYWRGKLFCSPATVAPMTL